MDELLAMSPATKALAVGLWFLLLLVGERLFPAAIPPETARVPGPGWRRLLRNAGFWVLNVLLSLAIVLPLTQGRPRLSRPWAPGGLAGGAAWAACCSTCCCWIS
jgi:hypothetical protein